MKQFLANDTRTAFIIGVIGGLLLQPILTDVLPNVSLLLRAILFCICLIGSPLGLILLTNIFPQFGRFFRFALVGALNTAVDLGLLNILIILFGQRHGYLFPVYATIGFFAATFNSYFWNRYWAFSDRAERDKHGWVWFYGVSVVGFFVNVGIATGLVHLGAPAGISLLLWENIAKAVGIAASLITNFLGYSQLVFKGGHNID
jgi:putative flippase GtrA